MSERRRPFLRKYGRRRATERAVTEESAGNKVGCNEETDSTKPTAVEQRESVMRRKIRLSSLQTSAYIHTLGRRKYVNVKELRITSLLPLMKPKQQSQNYKFLCCQLYVMLSIIMRPYTFKFPPRKLIWHVSFKKRVLWLGDSCFTNSFFRYTQNWVVCLEKSESIVSMQFSKFCSATVQEMWALRPPFPPGKNPVAHWTGRWVGPRASFDVVPKRKIPPCQESNHGRPAHRLRNWALCTQQNRNDHISLMCPVFEIMTVKYQVRLHECKCHTWHPLQFVNGWVYWMLWSGAPTQNSAEFLLWSAKSTWQQRSCWPVAGGLSRPDRHATPCTAPAFSASKHPYT
jgi:hypothetical protein